MDSHKSLCCKVHQCIKNYPSLSGCPSTSCTRVMVCADGQVFWVPKSCLTDPDCENTIKCLRELETGDCDPQPAGQLTLVQDRDGNLRWISSTCLDQCNLGSLQCCLDELPTLNNVTMSIRWNLTKFFDDNFLKPKPWQITEVIINNQDSTTINYQTSFSLIDELAQILELAGWFKLSNQTDIIYEIKYQADNLLGQNNKISLIDGQSEVFCISFVSNFVNTNDCENLSLIYRTSEKSYTLGGLEKVLECAGLKTEQSACNSTTHVALTPFSDQTNVSLSVGPKGDGFLSAQKPTPDYPEGGNCRGTNAVDWQMKRNLATQVASGAFSVIGGGLRNQATGTNSVVVGGLSNVNNGNFSFVGGGRDNNNNSQDGFIGGGQSNQINQINQNDGNHLFIGAGVNNNASGNASLIGAGNSNLVNGTNTSIVGGFNNKANSNASFIGGGEENQLSGAYSVITGGQSNQVKSFRSFIGSGFNNNSIGDFSFIGSGQNNQAIAFFSTIIGGSNNNTGDEDNKFIGIYSFIGNGQSNQNKGNSSFIGGGENNKLTANGSLGFIGAGFENEVTGATAVIVGGGHNRSLSTNTFIGAGVDNLADGSETVVVGGSNNHATADSSFIGGGKNNRLSGNASFIGGGQDHKITENGSLGFIGAGFENEVTGATAVIVGGGRNRSLSTNTFIGAGVDNLADGFETVVVGGSNNHATANSSFIGGGKNNWLTGNTSVVVGGENNIASGAISTIVNGSNNVTAGSASFIGNGEYNQTNNDFSFIGCGKYNQATADYSFIGSGSYANARLYGQHAHANGLFNELGDAQAGRYVLRKVIFNDDMFHPLYLDGNSQRLVIPKNATWTFSILIVARGRTEPSIYASFKVEGVIHNNNGTVSLNTIKTPINANGMDVLVKDDNNVLDIKVKGISGKTIQWVASVDTVETFSNL